MIVRGAWGCPDCLRVSVGTHEQNERFIAALAAVFIESLSGSYSGVMGLPLFETAELLHGAGVPYWEKP